MPLTIFAADAFTVVTICLVSLLIVLGLLCIIYTLYFRIRIHRQGFVQLSYFSGPWIIRISFILFAIWWGVGEVIRLSFLKGALSLEWQEAVCKCYIVSNLGFAEPCLFLTIVLLLRSPFQKMEMGVMTQKWNWKIVGYVVLYCLPVFLLQLFVILAGPQFDKNKSIFRELPHYFTSAATTSLDREHEVILCTYPLLSTVLLGIFAAILTAYLFWLGRRILKLVINKGLQRRVYTLMFSVSSFLLLRVLFLGLSVLSKPERFLFEALVFLAFIALLCCAGVCICLLVFYPVADSLELENMQDLEARRRTNDDCNETATSVIANHSHSGDDLEENVGPGMGRISDVSTKRGSVSFRTLEKGGTSDGTFVELSLFSPSRHGSPTRSPPYLGWPMRSPLAQV